MTKRIVLCADDYGQSPSISQGILNLVATKRLSATSCLVTSDSWADSATKLKKYQGQIDIGLHFNLTEGFSLSPKHRVTFGKRFLSLPALLRGILQGNLDPAVIETELNAQLDRFERELGFSPDFIDGHQHVHQLPIIRHALIKVFKARLNTNKTYIRVSSEQLKIRPKSFNIKKNIIRLTGLGFKKLIKQSHIPFNESFAGIYNFKTSKHYAWHFPQFLDQIKDQGIIMCHPGLAPQDSQDPIGLARFDEYNYFTSQQFIKAFEDRGIALSRFY